MYRLPQNANVNLTGQELTVQENTPDVTADANVNVTGGIIICKFK